MTDVVVIMIFVAIFGGYVVTSLLLLRFPRLLHRKKDIRFRATQISHRGGAGENLENTLAAFKHASECGTEMFELDCHLTQDGEVIVCHDENLLRTTGQDILVAQTLYKDLPLLSESLSLDFDHGQTICGGSDRRLPLLKEVFEAFPTMPMNIDIKVDNDELIRKVSQLAIEYRREALTVWGNRSSAVTRKCYAENPNIQLFFSLKRVFLLVFLFYSGLLPFVPLRESFYEILMPSVILKRGRFRLQISKTQRSLIRLFDFLLMSKVMFYHLRKRGIQTYVWVLNENEDFERALSYGVSGVMTDFPSKLSLFLQQHPQYCQI